MRSLRPAWLTLLLALHLLLGAGPAAADTLAVTHVTGPTPTSTDRTVRSSVSFLDLATGEVRGTLTTAEIPFVTVFGANFLIAHSTPATAASLGTARIIEYDPVAGAAVTTYTHPHPLASYFAPGWRTDGTSLVSAMDGRLWLLTERIAKDGAVEHWVEGITWETNHVFVQYRVPPPYFRRALINAVQDRCLVVLQGDGLRTESRVALLGETGLLGEARLGIDIGDTLRALDVVGDRALGATQQGKILRIQLERDRTRMRVAQVGELPEQELRGVHWPRAFEVLAGPLANGGLLVVGLNGEQGIDRLRVVDITGTPRQGVDLERPIYRMVLHAGRCYGIDMAAQSLVTYDLGSAALLKAGPANALLGTVVDFAIGG